MRDSARRVVADALILHPDINVIFGINDDSALGGLDAFYALGLDDRNLFVCSFGLEGNTSKDMLMAGGPFKASVAMFPELVGKTCVDAANCAYHGCHLPERIITPFVIATAANLEDYYERDDHAGVWRIKWGAVQRLPSAGTTLAMLSDCNQQMRPARIGYVLAWGAHHWYRNLRHTMEERAWELGIKLEVIDASNDVEEEIDWLKRLIGQTAACYVAEGETVILDGGLTCTHLAGALHGRRGITILTNSLRVLNELAQEPGIRLIATGGELRSDQLSLTGAEAESTFQGLRADKVFISGAGLSIDFGLSGTNLDGARVRQAMLAATRDAIVLADHTKIGVESLVRIAPIERFGRLITDAGISPHDRLSFTKRGIEVTIAEQRNLP